MLKYELEDGYYDTNLGMLSRKKIVQPNGYTYYRAYNKMHLLCDIRKCNAQIQSMYIRQLMEKHPIAHLEHTPDGIKMTITTDS